MKQADNQMLEQSPNTPFLVVGVFLIVGLSMCTVVYLRRQLLYSIKDYISYLKRIVNNPGSGYVLLKQSNLAIADNNIEALKVFDIEEDQLLDTFSSFFNEEERKVLISLKQGHKFKKQISLSRHNARNYAEIRITTVMLKNDAYWAITLTTKSKRK